MNLAARRLFLFFFSFAALTACDDPSDIGLELQDKNQIGTDYTDTLTVNTGTVLLNDSILSFNQSVAEVGRYADPVLGTVSATTFTEVGLGGSNLNFGENPVAQSLELTLDYGFKYGDTLQDMTVSAHRLTEKYDDKKSYFTNTELAYESTPLGTQTFRPLREKVVEKDKDGKDVTVTRTRLVKINLGQALANELIAQSGKDPLKTQQNFINLLNGLAIVASEGSTGSLIGLNLASDSTKITLTYRSGAEQKVQKHVFTFDGSNVRNSTLVKADRTGTSVAELTKGMYIPSSQTGGDSYVQATTQLLTKLTFPYLNKLKEQNGTNIIVNRAELILPVKGSSTSNNLPTPPQMVLYQTNNSNRILKNNTGVPLSVQQEGASTMNTTQIPVVVTKDAKKDYYSVNITSYVQAMLLDKKPNDGLLLAPAVVSSAQNGTRQIQTEPRSYRAIFSNTDANRVKLLLYYSKIK
ncbi:DUF4270 family protein [Pontibacter ruber]|uniref:DUF4270 family protein n=1 Tax=Pontibacter ruber TaxID=1343895 RepID=A0ABW5CZJ0_9BACT|nr:DUF4270 family protein [Pontibacter ruber]